MITKRKIQAAYKKVCPYVNPSITDMFTMMIEEAIRNQNGAIFANRKAKNLKEVFRVLTDICLPHDVDETHQTFDHWVFHYSIENKLPIAGHLIARLRSYGCSYPVPDNYDVNQEGGWDLMKGFFTTRRNRIVITQLRGRVFEVYTNDPNIHVVKLPYPSRDIESCKSYRRIA